MELRHLRYFVATAEEENITRASLRLRVAQPSLSRQIRDLEDMLGLSLFARSAKSVRLTASGKAFLIEARAILARVDEALLMAKTLAGGSRKEIHVGYAPSLTVELLPRTLRFFQEIHPDVHVRLYDLSTEEMVNGLSEGTLDITLMIRATTKSMKGIAFESLRKFPVCVAAHPAHPVCKVETLRLEHISGERLIIYSRAEYPEYHTWFHSLFAKAGLSPNIAEEHDGATSLIAAVEAGRGVALVQKGFECFAGPRLSVRPLVTSSSSFNVGVAYLKKNTSPLVESFLNAAKRPSEI